MADHSPSTVRPAALHSSALSVARGRDDEAAFTANLVALAETCGCYGYRKISALLKVAGWLVNEKRVERIWRWEGAPAWQPEGDPRG